MVLTFRERLKKILTSQEYAVATFSYDQVGNVAILDLPELLWPKDTEIGKALLESSKPITTVLRKVGKHEGEFRTQPLKVIAGIDTKEANYIESGVHITVDVEKVYFSPRLSTERERIARMINQGERILVMFSGCGIYPLVFSKHSTAKEIIGIEINPVGHEYALLNVKKNKVRNVTCLLGDVHDIAKTLTGTFDRIVMPLPKTADEFLYEAKKLSHNGTIVHFYSFEESETMPSQTLKKIHKTLKSAEMVSWVKCGPHKPGWFRICVDVRV